MTQDTASQLLSVIYIDLPAQSKEPTSWQLLLKWNLRAKNIKETILKV